MPVARTRTGLPSATGIGLRTPHVAEVLATLPTVGWLEVHSENYFMHGGPALAVLAQCRASYPVSLHGVGLSLGSADGLNPAHLQRLVNLAARIEPAAISEHLSWGAIDGRYLHDLLPLPYTREALQLVCQHVDQVQEALGRPLLVENISSYLRFVTEDMPEWDFLAALSKHTGCQLLLDINNIYVSACNHGFSPHDFLNGIPVNAVAEMHLAGYEQVDGLLIDTHSTTVSAPVWDLYCCALQRFGPQPTLLEWDQQIPPLSVLLDEANQAQRYLEHCLDAQPAIPA